uniref:Uncharacterized protein n=1 Tax=Timema bartmani TaxID=61472 RepID=A0A7R9FC62_9NEOP|nr:unnamed protein product [Timema bartmani]
MAGLLRNFTRRLTTSPSAYNTGSNAAVAGHGGGGVKLWKRLSFLVAFPAVGLCMLNCYLMHQKETHERPPFVPYEHLRIRNKGFDILTAFVVRVLGSNIQGFRALSTEHPDLSVKQ